MVEGILITGTLLSKYQHYKAGYRDMHREAVMIGQTGIVRTPDNRAWHSGHFTIKAIGLVDYSYNSDILFP